MDIRLVSERNKHNVFEHRHQLNYTFRRAFELLDDISAVELKVALITDFSNYMKWVLLSAWVQLSAWYCSQLVYCLICWVRVMLSTLGYEHSPAH